MHRRNCFPSLAFDLPALHRNCSFAKIGVHVEIKNIFLLFRGFTINSAVDSAVNSDINSAEHSAVNSAVDSVIDSVLNSAKSLNFQSAEPEDLITERDTPGMDKLPNSKLGFYAMMEKDDSWIYQRNSANFLPTFQQNSVKFLPELRCKIPKRRTSRPHHRKR